MRPSQWIYWRRSLSDFRLLKVVGEGQMAVVYHAEHRQSRTPVALKVYAKHTLSVVTRRQVDREIAIQGRLTHSNIIKLVRVTFCKLLHALALRRMCLRVLLLFAEGNSHAVAVRRI